MFLPNLHSGTVFPATRSASVNWGEGDDLKLETESVGVRVSRSSVTNSKPITERINVASATTNFVPVVTERGLDIRGNPIAMRLRSCRDRSVRAQ